jgi:hypothetical protein
MQAAWLKLSSAGLGSTLRAGTITCSAKVPWCFSVSSVRLGSSVSSPVHPSVAMTEWMTTSVPSSSTPAPSQPSVIGNCSALIPTPRKVHRSCMLTLAARTLTRTQPSGAVGASRSPTRSASSGASEFGSAA